MPKKRKKLDTPSHIMRELERAKGMDGSNRYTLTYNEGTKAAAPDEGTTAIHPHI